MRQIRIGRRKYVAGLWWQIADSARQSRKAVLAEARERAASFDDAQYDCVVVHGRQFGLGESGGNIPTGISLASALLDRGPATWIGLFRLAEDCWWVCAVNSGSIAGDGDHAAATEEDARARMADLQALTDWGTEVECLTVEESLQHLASLVHGGRPVMPIQGRSRLIPATLMVLAAVFAALALYGLDRHQDFQAREQARAAVERARLASQARQRALQENPGRHFPQPWATRPGAGQYVSACMAHFLNLPLFDAGWELTRVEYSDESVTIFRKHQPGASFTTLPHGASLDRNPAVCVATESLSGLTPRAEKPLAMTGEASARFYELTRMVAGKARTVNFDPPLKKTLENGAEPVAVLCPWVRGGWSLSSVNPSAAADPAFSAALRAIPGLVVTRLEAAPEQLTLEGDLYARQ